MKTITIRTAMAKFSQLLARVAAGEEIILARGVTPIAKLVPYRRPAGKRRFGAMRGVVSVGPEFFEVLPDQDLASWE